LILLGGVEKASIKKASFFDSGFRLWLPNGLRLRSAPEGPLSEWGSGGWVSIGSTTGQERTLLEM
jgi:hypothetical protein